MVKIDFNVKKFYTCVALLGLVFSGASSSLAQALPKNETQKSADQVLSEKWTSSKAAGERLIFDGREFMETLNAPGNPQIKFQSPEGPRTGGGGNSCALAIAQNTKKLLSLLDVIPEFLTPSSKSTLLKAMGEAKFYVKTDLQKNGQMKDAKNYPHLGKIVLTEKFCSRELVEVSGRSMSLLLHEYLGLARIDDRQYQWSGLFLEEYGKIQTSHFELQRYLEAEAIKDLRGLPSCFKGEVKKQQEAMAATYGGRFQNQFTIETILVNGSEFRSPAKYCEDSVNKDGNKICSTENILVYAASVVFNASTSGTFEREGQLYKIQKQEVTKLLVDKDADWIPTEQEIKSQKVETTISCEKGRSQ